MAHYHKHGGIHFLSIGRLRIQWSICNSAASRLTHNVDVTGWADYKPLPKAPTLAELYDGGEVPREVSSALSNPSYRNAMIESGRGRLIR